MGVTGRLKGYFLRGLAVLLPAVLTVWILVAGYSFLQRYVAVHINRGVVWLLWRLQGEGGPTLEQLTEIFVDGPAGSVVGVILLLSSVCLIGALLASVVGRALWHGVETFIASTPVLNRVYPYVKQVTDFVFANRDKQLQLFSRVVAVEYPRPGIWSLGLVTGEGLQPVNDRTGQAMLTVLIPNSPTPLTGYVVVVPRDLTIPLNLSIEEAFRFTISAGVITPSQGPGGGRSLENSDTS